MLYGRRARLIAPFCVLQFHAISAQALAIFWTMGFMLCSWAKSNFCVLSSFKISIFSRVRYPFYYMYCHYTLHRVTPGVPLFSSTAVFCLSIIDRKWLKSRYGSSVFIVVFMIFVSRRCPESVFIIMEYGEDESVLLRDKEAAAAHHWGRQLHPDPLLPATETERQPERRTHHHPHAGEPWPSRRGSVLLLSHPHTYHTY